MKKLLYIAFAALGLAACTREVVPEKENEDIAPKVKVSFKAVFEQEDLTKAEINSEGYGKWEAGDQIAVHTKLGNIAILSAETAGTAVTFSGNLEVVGDAIEDNAIAYYPASIAIQGDATKVNLPESYDNPEAAAKGFILRGVLSGDAISFQHIGALLKVTINSVPSEVTSVVFSSSNAITGNLNVSIATPEAPECEIGSGSGSITIASSPASRSTSATVFFFPLPTGTLTGGFTIALKNGESTVASKATTNDVTIARAKLVKMKAYTPDGAPSNWYIPGKFNGWNTTATQMSAVLGHENWLVARGITLPDYSGEDQGFKFFKKENETETWIGGNCIALHNIFTPDGSSNIDFTHNKTYDIYYNPTDNQAFLANSGEPWYRTIYMMTDMRLSDSEANYNLYLWYHNTENNISAWPGHSFSGVETISGIKYYKFQYEINSGEYPEAGTYDCVFNDGPSSIRYDFRDGKLVISNNDGGDYYVSFTSDTFNGNHGEGKTNPMTQFSDPSDPKGESKWDVYFGGIPHYMHWDGPMLVCKNLLVNSTTEICFRFKYDDLVYRPVDWSASYTVQTKGDYDFEYKETGRSNAQFTISDLTGPTYCDFYLDIFNNKAKIVPSDMVTLYFGLTDREVDHAYFYSWGAWSTSSFPGDEMTTYETINRIKYYKTVLPASSVGDQTAHFIISDGSHEGHWQTSDYVSTIPSGSGEYYFNISGETITKLNNRPEVISITIDGEFSDWAKIAGNVQTATYNTTTMKAYSDGTHLFVYAKAVQTEEGSLGHGLDSNSQISLFFDKDNKSGTGSTAWYNKGADDTGNNFRVKLLDNGLRDVLAISDYNASAIAVDDTVNKIMEVEIKFDLAALNYNNTIEEFGKYIKIFCLGYDKQEFVGNVTVLY